MIFFLLLRQDALEVNYGHEYLKLFTNNSSFGNIELTRFWFSPTRVNLGTTYKMVVIITTYFI